MCIIVKKVKKLREYILKQSSMFLVSRTFLCMTISLFNNITHASSLPQGGQNLWHVTASIGTDVDTLLECCIGTFTTIAALGPCDSIALFQTDVNNGTMLLTTTGASYCLSQNITGSLVVSAPGITVDLNAHSLIGVIDILVTGTQTVIKNGSVNPTAPLSLVDATHAAIVSAADRVLIEKCYVVCADSTSASAVGRDGIYSTGVSSIIDSCFVQAGAGGANANGGNGITVIGSDSEIFNCTVLAGTAGSPLAYTLLTTGFVTLIDTVTNAEIGTSIGVGNAPDAIAVTPDGTQVYVVNNGSNNVTAINTATLATKTISVGTSPDAIAITPDGTKAYVVNHGSGTVSVIDTATNTVIHTITVGTTPVAVAITPNGTQAYVANQGSANITVIDIATNSTTTISTGGNLTNVAITPDGTQAYVINYGFPGFIYVVDTADNIITTTITVGNDPNSITFSPNDTRAYTVNGNSASVSVIDTLTNTVIDTISIENESGASAITPDGTQLYVAAITGFNVTVIDTATNALATGFTNPIPLTGVFPNGVFMTPDGTQVYVTSDNGVDVISTIHYTDFFISTGNANAIAITGGYGGSGIWQQGSKGKIINNIITGGINGVGAITGGDGVLVDLVTDANIIQDCLATNCGGSGFSMLTTGTVNILECIANYNVSSGFDMSGSVGKGLIKACNALQNLGCGFNDRVGSMYKYLACVAEGNGDHPGVTPDTNYCLVSTGTAVGGVTPPYYQFSPNNAGSGFAPTYWNNITL